MRRWLFLALLCLIAARPSRAEAHFLWLWSSPQANPAVVKVYFGEAAEPDDPALLDKVAKAEVWAIGGRGGPQPIALRKGEAALEGELAPASRGSTLILRHAYGVVTKGGESFQLRYYAKAYSAPLPGTWQAVRDAERLPLEITPALQGTQVRLTVAWKGEPLAGSQVTIVGPGIDSKIEGTTDAAGQFTCTLPQAGTYSIRAKHSQAEAGQAEQVEYKSIRHYSTLTLPYAPAAWPVTMLDVPPLPRGTTSFGGATLGDSVYVYGGNYGSAHHYDRDDQSGDLWRLNLARPEKWEALPGGPKLQGLAAAAHDGKFYRVGGFAAQNGPNEAEDLRSQPDVARFDPQRNAWESLPPLPEPRSSHDAAVLGDTLYVVGGWNLQGTSKTATWHTSALALNLRADKLEWKPIAPPPFQRRALALAAHRGMLYCLGGMQDQGGPTTAVAIYDPAKNAWTTGPALLGGPMDGFGSSAFACRDQLIVTTVTGSVQRLAPDGSTWEFVGQSTQPRFFHRLLPWGDSRLVLVGGASMEEGKIERLESLEPPAPPATVGAVR